MQKRTARSAAFKKKVALAPLKENATAEEVAQRFGVHVTQVHKWKRELTDNAVLFFGSKKHSFEEKEMELHAQLGKLAVENAWLKKIGALDVSSRLSLGDPQDEELSVRKQVALLDVPRSSYYYVPARETSENLELMRLIDREYTRHPFLGQDVCRPG